MAHPGRALHSSEQATQPGEATGRCCERGGAQLASRVQGLHGGVPRPCAHGLSND